MKIDRTIPIPSQRDVHSGGRPRKYDWAGMAIGDSYYERKRPASAKASAWAYARIHGWKFTTRRDKNGTRIWRTA